MRKKLAVFATAFSLSAVICGAVWAQTSTTVLDGVYTQAQAAKGEADYSQNCAACHGSTLGGNGEAPALVGAQFISDWAGLTLGDLYDRIRTTMPQDDPGGLNRTTYAEILAYLLKANGYPAGQRPLDRRTPYLKAIGFVPPPRPDAPSSQHSSAAQPAKVAQAGAAAGSAMRRRRGPGFPPSDLAALAAADKASGVLSATAGDPRNAPNSQPNPYATNEHFFKLPPGRHFGSSSSVAGDSKGHIWVVDRCGANNCAGSSLDPVMEFDSHGNFIKAFGAGMLLFPHDLYIDRNDHLWVVDDHVDAAAKIGNDVIEFDQNGKVLMRLGTPGATGDTETTLNAPTAVLVAPNGNIFVADGHDPGPGNNARIVKYDSHGKYLMQWGTHGIKGGEFEVPHCLAMDQEGHLYVGDRWNNRIQEFDQNGKLLRIFTQFGRPSGIFIDKHDILYSTDSESRNPMGYGYHPGWKRGIRIGSVKDGIVTAFIPDTYPDPDKTATSGGEGIWADGNGVVYSAQVGQRNIVRYVKQ